MNKNKTMTTLFEKYLICGVASPKLKPTILIQTYLVLYTQKNLQQRLFGSNFKTEKSLQLQSTNTMFNIEIMKTWWILSKLKLQISQRNFAPILRGKNGNIMMCFKSIMIVPTPCACVSAKIYKVPMFVQSIKNN